MDSFLSGFSHSYEGTSVGQGYAGNVSVTGNAGSAGTQGVDVTQLQPGDTFQGEIVSVNGEDVQIQLTNGQYMAAKLERDVQVAIGQFMNLQVQSNKDNRVVLKPVYDGKMQMLRVGESALRAAQMAVNDRNLTLVSTLIENGMSINKNTLMLFNRLTLQNPTASIADLIKLNKLQLPVNDNSIIQLQNYQNMEHKLLDGIREASDEILKLYDTLTGNAEMQANQSTMSSNTSDSMQGAVSGQTALENGGKFMEQVLVLLAGEEEPDSKTQATADNHNDAAASQEDPEVQPDAGTNSETATVTKNNPQGSTAVGNAGNRTVTDKDAGYPSKQGEAVNQNKTSPDTILEQLKGERPQTLPDKIVSIIREGIRDSRFDIKDIKQLLLDSDLGKQLTTEQKAEIFRSEPFQSMIKNGLQKQWTLTPQELAQEGRVEEFYQKLAKESSQLTRMMNEAMQASGQSGSGTQARAMGNISENVEFMNQMNQMFNYVQLPLKLSNSQAHGDLYVYTNKKNMARKDGMLTAFLHLDMDHLGALDVSISLQTERNQITTKFYLDEDAIALVEEHIDELAQRLSKKGYQCKNMILEKEEDKTVLERMEEQVAGGNAVLSYQTFDTRA
ncbi:MAG: flagellar hook-length control protein FliK [Lachnospiraceae bacterium]|nr:flagellar hook-length control protein FliK [Lachnospiraceae bacterium]